MTAESWSFDLENYVVLFLDVMGQKDEIFRFHLVPDDTKLGTEVVLATAGFVRELRERATMVLDGSHRETELMKSLPSDQQEDLRRATRSTARVSQTLSDALVIATSVGRDENDFTPVANAIRWALVTSSWAQLTALAQRHAIRGGIDVGWGVLLDESEVYGAALGSAYQLESKRAEYPRVICGSELLRFLEVIIDGETPSKSAHMAARIAEDAKRYLQEDDDGLFAVDFMGEAFHEGAQNVPGIGEMVQTAYDFVVDEHERFTSDGPEKLANRYRRLESYMQSNLDIWK